MVLSLPIRFEYDHPSQEFLDSLRQENTCVGVQEQPGITLGKNYFRQGIRGSLDATYLRARVFKGLKDALGQLPSGFGFTIFDAYRSKETQAGLFEAYSRQIAKQNPHLTAEQLYSETRKFVAHPDEPSRFEVPPHNSGGAVDVGLTYKSSPLEMGTPFDDLTDKAATDFFEKSYDNSLGINEEEWAEARKNRRILFHSMRSAGFTNWKHEWWHFDMGNCVWAQELGIPWVYDSMIP